MELYLVVFLVDCRRKKTVVPVNFIENLSFAKTFNLRINRNQKHSEFWCENFNEKPNFKLKVGKTFVSRSKACYTAKLLKAFGKYFLIVFSHITDN